MTPNRSISEVVAALLVEGEGDPDGKIALDDMVHALGNRAFGVLLLLFGLPNCFPMPPGIPILCGVVVGAVAFQMLMGRTELALPRWLGTKRVDRALLARVIDRSKGVLNLLEAISRPRFPNMSGEWMRRAIGFAGLALAVALMAPIPIFGGIPAGIAVTLLGLAFAQRDGVLIGFGVVVATPVALAVTSAMVFALVQGAAAFF